MEEEMKRKIQRDSSGGFLSVDRDEALEKNWSDILTMRRPGTEKKMAIIQTKQWEYQVVILPDNEEQATCLQSEGDDGWELVAAFPLQTGQREMRDLYFYFKREKQ